MQNIGSETALEAPELLL